MEKYAELEISLHRREEEEYAVEFRYIQPDSAVDVRLGEVGHARLDLFMLRSQAANPQAYAQSLTDCFFSDPEIRTQLARARSNVEALNLPLRVRLLIGPTAPELHTLYWEQLLDPNDGAPLFTGEKIVFSRYLSSLNLRSVKLGPKTALRALVFIANPSNLSRYDRLAPIDADSEFERARQGLGSIPATRFAGGPATLNNLVEVLRTQKPAILYLVCHGGLLRDEPYLWLEDAGGQTVVTPAKELATRLKELSEPPLLVVLASCKSAGFDNAGDARAALGPRLADAGIPAVVAMQGSISMQTVAEFMPVFFHELQQDGQVDRAMSLARGEVRARFDHWMPVLFTRLKNGSIFTEAARPKPRTWRFWAAVASTGLLVLAAALGVYTYASRPPSLGSGFNVVVAMFTEVDPSGRERVTENSRQLSRLLFEEINQETETLRQIHQFELLEPDRAGPIIGKDWDSAVRKLAGQTNASLIIYGTLVHTPEGYIITPQFYVSDQTSFTYGNEITGTERLGKGISLGSIFDLKAVEIDPKLRVRTRVLRRIMSGLAYLSTANYPRAELDLSEAAFDPIWADDEGKEVAFLLLGGAQLLQYDPHASSRTAVLSKARDSFNKAIRINSGYARPYLGLAQIAYLGAMEEISQAERAKLIDEAESKYLMALDRSEPGSLVATKASYGLGVTAVIRVEKALPGWKLEDADTAKQKFEAVIKTYEENKTAGLPWYAAHSYAHLARIAGWYEKWDEMVLRSQDAIAVLRTLPGVEPQTWIARYYVYIAAAEKYRGNIDAEINAYNQAIEIGREANASAEELKSWEDDKKTLEKGNP